MMSLTKAFPLACRKAHDLLLKGNPKQGNVIGPITRSEIKKLFKESRQFFIHFTIQFTKNRCLKVTKTWPWVLAFCFWKSCVCDVINNASMCGISIYYATSQPFFFFCSSLVKRDQIRLNRGSKLKPKSTSVAQILIETTTGSLQMEYLNMFCILRPTCVFTWGSIKITTVLQLSGAAKFSKSKLKITSTCIPHKALGRKLHQQHKFWGWERVQSLFLNTLNIPRGSDRQPPSQTVPMQQSISDIQPRNVSELNNFPKQQKKFSSNPSVKPTSPPLPPNPPPLNWRVFQNICQINFSIGTP